jgi:hypothetical protein
VELLIQVFTDPVKPTIHPPGDVIWYAPDSAQWGKEEYNHPNWMIVRVPGMSELTALGLIGPELPSFRGQKTFHLRGSTVDVVGLGLTALAKLPNKGHGSSPEAIVERTAFMAAVSLKPPSTS